MRRNAQQIDEAKVVFPRRVKEGGVVMFGWGREYEDVSCFSLNVKVINILEIRTEATNNVSAELSEERRRLFGCLDTMWLWMFIMRSSSTRFVARK